MISNENQTDSLSFDEFMDKADILLVDNAKSFDINKWENAYKQDILEEIDDADAFTTDNSETKSIKYKLDGDQIKKVIKKISTERFYILDGITSRKIRQFLKKNNVELDDLQQVLYDLKEENYKFHLLRFADYNDGFNEAVIFCKNSKTKEPGAFGLYMKLDYDTIEEAPTIIISVFKDFTIFL